MELKRQQNKQSKLQCTTTDYALQRKLTVTVHIDQLKYLNYIPKELQTAKKNTTTRKINK